jgi:hypothetical protein
MIKLDKFLIYLRKPAQIIILIMRGKKRPYGRFNVQSENARGQIRYETPMQQLQFLQ